MPSFVANAVDKAKSFWGRINMSQRLLVGGIAAALIIAFFIMIMALNRTEMAALYSNLGMEDANRVIKSLDAQKTK